jgi:hypothetical protein
MHFFYDKIKCVFVPDNIAIFVVEYYLIPLDCDIKKIQRKREYIRIKKSHK